jgi:hypothetical protein
MFKALGAKLCAAVAIPAIIIGSLSVQAADISQDTINALQAQINGLQKQLEELKAAQAEAAAKVPASTAPSQEQSRMPAIKSEGPGTMTIGRTKVTVGGFVEAAGIYRSKNETTDVASNFNTAIPFPITTSGGKNVLNPNAHQSELRGSARQSRITALAEAKPNEKTAVSAYVEADFLGAAPSANSIESNSYNPRLRLAYGTVDLENCGLHFLAGQEWSLLTTNKIGIIPRQENIPLTIDAQYVPGFNWTRNPQIRIAKDFDDRKLWLALSAESPQVNFGGITEPSFVNGYNPGVSPLTTTANYSSDFAPDVIGKATFDPGWGHYEAFGIARFFHDYVLTSTTNNTVAGYGGGAGVILPAIPEKLEVQANFMAGEGIGRYGSVQLPDFAFTPTGGIKPLPEYTALVGAVGHPSKAWDTYIYGGFEGVERANYATKTPTSIGYGDLDLLTGQEQTSDVWQITAGVWDRIYQGPFGKVQWGLQYSLTRRNAFSNSEDIAQHAYESTFMTSFRFYPM